MRYLGVALVEAFAVQADWADGFASGGAGGRRPSRVRASPRSLPACSRQRKPPESREASSPSSSPCTRGSAARAPRPPRSARHGLRSALAAVAVSDLLSGAWLAVTWAAAAVPSRRRRLALGRAQARTVRAGVGRALAAVQALDRRRAARARSVSAALRRGRPAPPRRARWCSLQPSALLLPAEQCCIACLGSLYRAGAGVGSAAERA